ncbi:MAG: polyphenol oxidase family protein [Candidatus Margulisbacteria bacterium]|nr:polyphenol oxidase family protein [Candidatus Margulisiibacteriota bacterium]
MALFNVIPDSRVSSCLSTRKDTLEDILTHLPHETVWEMNQVHLDQIQIIDSLTHSEYVSQDNKRQVPHTDALISTQINQLLLVRSADCLPVLIFHPNPLVAAIHAGRKGTEMGILKKVLSKIQAEYGLIDGFKIWLGPRICTNCYEMDLVEENMKQIREQIDISKSHVIDCKVCTSCQNEHYFSYRKEGPGSGRIYSGIRI